MLSLPVIVELRYILNLWLGDVVPDYTIPFTILILIIMILSSLNTPLSQVVHATGKMKNYQIGTSIVMCTILPIAWIVLKLWGNPVSVYVVSLIMTVINQSVCMVLLKRIFPYSIAEYMKEVIWPCVIVTIISVIPTVLAHYLLQESFIRLLIVGVLGVGTSVLSSYFLVMNEMEKMMIMTFMKKIFKKK